MKGDDLTALAAAVREAAKGYEWSAEKAVETEELLHWLVLAYVREAVRSYDEWLPEEFLFCRGFYGGGARRLARLHDKSARAKWIG